MAASCWKCGAAPLGASSDPPAPSTTPLTHLLESNDTPSDSELPLVRIIVAAQQDVLLSLDTEIHDMQVALAQLVARRDANAKILVKCQAIISAVRRVPSELVCKIFALTLDNERDQGAVKPPWHLGHICRMWRLSALGYSPLWNHITIPTQSRRAFDPSMVEAQLLRSAHAALDVLCPTKVDAQSLDLVFAQSPRWRSFCLHVSETAFNRLHNIKGRLDRLVKLELVKAHGTVIPDVFQDAPSLREVILSDWKFRRPSPTVQLPWAQITRYRAMDSWSRQRQILVAAPNLRECAIAFMRTEAQTAANDTALIVLPQLCRLCTVNPELLERLTAPLLESIYSPLYSDNLILVLPPFIRRSACALGTLVLMNFAIPTELIPVLRDLPSLTYLAIEPCDMPGTKKPQHALLRAMTKTVSATGQYELCPQLASFTYGTNTDFPERAFFGMAKLRFERLRRVRLFQVRAVRGYQEILEEELGTLSNHGFDAALLDSAEMDLLMGKDFFSA
ncbi:hypothetical protein C8R46DRAFT_996143 [Mycena filopes]|nr:hypothetical protein C8R46DRAFT_996143 [Mycena filopes]